MIIPSSLGEIRSRLGGQADQPFPYQAANSIQDLRRRISLRDEGVGMRGFRGLCCFRPRTDDDDLQARRQIAQGGQADPIGLGNDTAQSSHVFFTVPPGGSQLTQTLTIPADIAVGGLASNPSIWAAHVYLPIIIR